ncbi:hypothetical protein [Bradyrhizobium sp. RDM4]|uniref:hypothetical protein n=1 Tax=Bradyrhizobium sp. RDM4 TaxID=3378765 RepID=UPI0038FCFC11
MIAATLDRLQGPLSVAGRCRDELREVLQPIENVVLHHDLLPAAAFNHARMLSRAAQVSATHAALLPVAYPHIVATPIITDEIALTMLTVLFGAVGKAKGGDAQILLEACIDMFGSSDAIGAFTRLWRPVSTHPVILALAVRQLINTAVFTSVAELRDAMLDAQRSIIQLTTAADRWRDLLRVSDRVLFEFDRAAWMQAYASVGADVVEVMQDADEAGDEDEDAPPAPRWIAQEAMRRVKVID